MSVDISPASHSWSGWIGRESIEWSESKCSVTDVCASRELQRKKISSATSEKFFGNQGAAGGSSVLKHHSLRFAGARAYKWGFKLLQITKWCKWILFRFLVLIQCLDSSQLKMISLSDFSWPFIQWLSQGPLDDLGLAPVKFLHVGGFSVFVFG